MNEHVQVFTGANWETDVLQSKQPVLVDFWAEWCGPCRALAPAVDAVASELQGRAVVGKLNVDENPEIAGRYGVMSIPTVLVFMGGKVVEQRVGLMPKDQLGKLLTAHVPQAAPARA
ncbi:MAG TPA: thioredoxin [Vicinamibacteria bacterium]|nr:thioredoxin [Vicinamibacteria bacterium]